MKRALTTGSVSGLLFLTSVGLLTAAVAPPKPPSDPEPPAGASVITKHDPSTMRLTIEWKPYDPPVEVSTWMSASLNSRDVLRGVFIAPITTSGPFHQVDPATIAIAARVRQEPVPLKITNSIDPSQLTAEYRAEFPATPAMELTFGVTMVVTSWNITFDEQAAQRSTWPREWPAEAQAGLLPQFGIEDEHQVFKRAVQEATKGRLRRVSPHLSAKELLRYTVNHVRIVEPQYAKMKPDSTGEDDVVEDEDGNRVRVPTSELLFQDDPIEAQQFFGSVFAAGLGYGSKADLVAVCVGILRAAGIPARPVVGVERRGVRGRFTVWGEYYLNDVGWVPFDPEILQNERMRLGQATDPYPGVGGVPGMNQRVPLSYSLLPPGSQMFELVPPMDRQEIERNRLRSRDRSLPPGKIRRVETRPSQFNQSRRFISGFSMIAELNGEALSPTFAHLYPRIDIRFDNAPPR